MKSVTGALAAGRSEGSARIGMNCSDNRIEELVRTLPVPYPFDRNVLIDNLARDRGRPIQLLAVDAGALADSPCGMWVSTDDCDWICHESGTTEYHIDQIVAHEIGHMMLGHSNAPQFDDARGIEWCRRFLPSLDPSTVQEIFGRTNHSTNEERDAEMFAHLLMVGTAESANPSTVSSAFFR